MAALDTYNADVLAQVCEKCDAQVNQRCKPSRGAGVMIGRPIPAHNLRIAAAGYVFDKATNTLVKLADLAARMQGPFTGPNPPDGVRRVIDKNGQVWVNVVRLGMWYPENRIHEGEGVTWAILVMEYGPIRGQA